MLILSRNKDDRVFINGGEIIITAIEIRDGTVRLGFEADRSVVIEREEVMDRTKASNESNMEARQRLRRERGMRPRYGKAFDG